MPEIAWQKKNPELREPEQFMIGSKYDLLPLHEVEVGELSWQILGDGIEKQRVVGMLEQIYYVNLEDTQEDCVLKESLKDIPFTEGIKNPLKVASISKFSSCSSQLIQC